MTVLPSSAPPAATTPCDAAEAARAVVLSSEQILNLLPHRYPFALVDRVVEYVPGKKAVASRTSPSTSPSSRAISPAAP